MKDVVKYAAINSLATVMYIIFVVLLINFLGNSFSDSKDIILIPIAMLMLFVFSATITGFLILGKPIMWYLDGKKQKAVSLFLYTLGIFLMIIFITFIFLIVLIK